MVSLLFRCLLLRIPLTFYYPNILTHLLSFPNPHQPQTSSILNPNPIHLPKPLSFPKPKYYTHHVPKYNGIGRSTGVLYNIV